MSDDKPLVSIVCPAFQLRLDTRGLGVSCPDGQIDRNDDAVAFVTVVLVATAAASPGTPPTFARSTVRCCW